ncbi:hypothetical protein [Agromyces laixinhei]|uniref:hypothetical protein n=1 Tax=Agromyces laixinhei TaxID=2585717 RepID=UPI0012ED367E|nr:hypothetical protein [Agromyces laixinhei]
MLLEFAGLWSRGLADTRKLWQLFDVCEMHLYRPDYFGAPVFRTGAGLITPVFSTVERLTTFVTTTPELGPASGASGFDLVRLTGAQLFGLPVRARLLAIDPGSDHGLIVDLATRADPPRPANGAPPIAINLELSDDGKVIGGPSELPETPAETEIA